MLNDANRIKKTYSVYRAPPTAIVNAMQLKEDGDLKATKPFINFVSGTTVSSNGDISMAMEIQQDGSVIANLPRINFVSGTTVSPSGDIAMAIQLKATGSLLATKSFINFVSGTTVSSTGDVSLAMDIQQSGVAKATKSYVNFSGGAVVSSSGEIQIPNKTFVNVKDPPFNAFGDGVTDDLANLNLAINNSTSGSTIFLPEGRYKISNSLTISKNLKFFGPGTIFHSGSRWGILINSDVVEFSGITFDGNLRLPVGNGDDDSLILTQPNTLLKLSNCKIIRPSRVGIGIYGSAIISNCEFNEFPKSNLISGTVGAIAGFAQSGTEQDLVITSNMFVMGSESDTNKEYNGWGVSVTADLSDSTPFRRLVIANNTFKYYGIDWNSGESGAIDTYNGGSDISITGNVFYDGAYCACKLQRATRFSVVGNVIDKVSNSTGTRLAFGIVVESNARSAEYPTLTEGTSGVIANNVIYAISSSLDGAGIHINTNNCIVSDNVIDGNYTTQRGITVVRGDDVLIRGNTVLSASVYGIELASSAQHLSNVKIESNSITMGASGSNAIISIGEIDKLNIRQNFIRMDAANNNAAIEIDPGPKPYFWIPKNIDIVSNTIYGNKTLIRTLGTSRLIVHSNVLRRTTPGTSFSSAILAAGCDEYVDICNNVLPEEADNVINLYDVTERITSDLAHANNRYHWVSPAADDWTLFSASADQKLVDGDMETVGTGAWTSLRATLSKVGSAHSGTQCLKIESDSTAPNAVARQTGVLIVGNIYLVVGWAKSDGVGIPRIGYASEWWAGTTSTSWQPFCFTVVNDYTTFGLTTDVGNTVYFDDIGVWEIG